MPTKQKKGIITKAEILATAANLASVEGLEGLTIARLAAEVGMSKSGLFAHFGSKLELQLATVEAARIVAANEVLRPGLASGQGLARAWALFDRWISYVERRVFRGGCFFAAVSAELDGRPGPVRDRVAAVMRDWLAALEAALAEGQRGGELRAGADARQLAFELNSLALGANWASQLLGDQTAFDRARAAARARLRAAAGRGPALD